MRSSRPIATSPGYEGIFCEPSSAAGLAGVRRLAAEGRLGLPSEATIVCVLTGNGLKDPTTAEAQAGGFIDAAATTGAVVTALGW